MVSLGFLRIIVRQAKLSLETGNFITGLFVSGTIEFAGANSTKFLLINELTFPGRVPALEYTAGFMKIETPARASVTFVGCAA